MLKVIGAGFGRTGTMSVRHALEELGYGPCYHMKVALTRPWHIPFWLGAIDGKKVRWKRFFRKYRATVDWPACEFYRELMQEYPGAKVILNVRDAGEWYESSLRTIYRIQRYFPWWFPKIFVRMQEKLIWQGRFEGRFEDRKFAIGNFLMHVEEVKSYVPAEKLLVYDVKQGWGPLCAFLGVPEPDRPFPHHHETDEYLRYIRRVKAGMNVLGALVIVLVLAALLLVYLKR
jgi:hypothetical protein